MYSLTDVTDDDDENSGSSNIFYGSHSAAVTLLMLQLVLRFAFAAYVLLGGPSSDRLENHVTGAQVQRAAPHPQLCTHQPGEPMARTCE